jgi:hypothetical protein
MSYEQVEVYPLDFLRIITSQFPFAQIEELSKRLHYPTSRLIRREVEEIVNANKEQIFDLSNSIVKVMESEVTLLAPDASLVNDMKNKLEYVNDKFKHINEFYEECTAVQKRELLLPFLSEESNKLDKYYQLFVNKVTEKGKWDNNDADIIVYYKLYTDFLKILYNKIKTTRRNDLEGSIKDITNVMFFYKPVLIAYMLESNLNNDVLVKRLAELRSYLIPRFGITPSNTFYEFYNQKLLEIAPITIRED